MNRLTPGVILAMLICMVFSCKNRGVADKPVDQNSGDVAVEQNFGDILFSFPDGFLREKFVFRILGEKPVNIGKITTEDIGQGKSQVRLKDIVLGNHSIIVRATSTGGSLHAHLFHDIRVNFGETSAVTVANIPVAATLTGKVLLQDEASPREGIQVSLPGTGYSAETGIDGLYTIGHLPAMNVSLSAQVSNYWNGRIEAIKLVAGDIQNLEALRLLPKTYADGSIFVDRISSSLVTDDSIQSTIVRFILVPPKNANEMRYSPSEDSLSSQAWVPIKSNISLEYEGSGEKSLYIDYGKRASTVRRSHVDFEISNQ